jgi:hypothetical protein
MKYREVDLDNPSVAKAQSEFHRRDADREKNPLMFRDPQHERGG